VRSQIRTQGSDIADSMRKERPDRPEKWDIWQFYRYERLIKMTEFIVLDPLEIDVNPSACE
jgi:hypothetical protein